MTGNDLLLWRKAHKMNQADLGKELARTRQTIIRWEQLADEHVPAGVAKKLAQLERVLANDAPPPVLTWQVADQYPDIKLYMDMGPGFRHVPAHEHPRNLMEYPIEHKAAIPLAVMDDPEYRRRLAAFRAKTWKPSQLTMQRPVLPPPKDE